MYASVAALCTQSAEGCGTPVPMQRLQIVQRAARAYGSEVIHRSATNGFVVEHHACTGYCARCGEIHSLCRTQEAEEAVLSLERAISAHANFADDENTDFTLSRWREHGSGNMLGVLLTRDPSTGNQITLKAFSGQLLRRWSCVGWCPAVPSLNSESAEYVRRRATIEHWAAHARKAKSELKALSSKREHVRRMHTSAIAQMQQRIDALKMKQLSSTFGIETNEEDEKNVLKHLVKKQRQAKAQSDRVLHSHVRQCEEELEKSKQMHRSLSADLHSDIMNSYVLINGYVRMIPLCYNIGNMRRSFSLARALSLLLYLNSL